MGEHHPQGGEPSGSTVIRTVQVVINPLAGSVTPSTEAEARTIFEKHGIDAGFHVATGPDLEGAMRAAIDAGPDLVVVIAGDGTARAAAEMCGPEGPLCAPLPGGTMNVLPRALYGERKWAAALEDILTDGCIRNISGGEIDGRLFFVAAILGSPALWAEAREAARELKPITAVKLAQHALSQAFKGRLRFALEGHEPGRSEALTLLCPLISTELPDDARVLEAAAVDPGDAAGVFRLAFHALVDNWRSDPGVETWRCRKGRAWARGRIPAVIDGEPIKLEKVVHIGFRPKAFRALACRQEKHESLVAEAAAGTPA